MAKITYWLDRKRLKENFLFHIEHLVTCTKRKEIGTMVVPLVKMKKNWGLYTHVCALKWVRRREGGGENNKWDGI